MRDFDPKKDTKIKEFIAELAGFAQTAEKTLSEIEKDLLANRGLFKIFFDRMVAIRGTAQQLALPDIAKIAGLGEEIAVKAQATDVRPQLRKCVGALWDALTTVKYLLEHYTEKTSEEQDILIHRLDATLKSMGGARPAVDADEIAILLKQRG